MIGHEQLVRDFTRLASQDKLGHGYIFFGPPRVGKRLFALSLANLLERKTFSDEGKVLIDVSLVLSENQSIGIEAIRAAKDFLMQTPIASSRRALIIDNAELLTLEAQNALLKTAEEPPPHGLVILVTSEPQFLWPTLVSRLQQIFFGAVPRAEIEKWLVAQEMAKQPAAAKLAKAVSGEPGLAWALLHDTAFIEKKNAADELMALRPEARAERIKVLVDDENFSLTDFLDALMIALALAGKKHAETWHRVLELRQSAGYFNLNPRLQLTALLT